MKFVQNLVVSDLLDQFAKVFGGLGQFPTILNETAVPKVTPIRGVPRILQDRLKHELMKQCIIKEVDKPTEWLNALVIVGKPNGDLLLRFDSQDLNDFIEREHFSIPFLSDISSKLSGKPYFSIQWVRADSARF